jgi:hypothetical protein
MVAAELKKLAFKYLRLADTTGDFTKAARLRLLAADYWDKGTSGEAAPPASQQQQQIQPDKDKPESGAA